MQVKTLFFSKVYTLMLLRGYKRTGGEFLEKKMRKMVINNDLWTAGEDNGAS